jgi:hypothetical protein
LLKVANSIHTRGKLVQIVLAFLILGIVINWCHSFTKLTGTWGKCTTGSLSKLFTLLCTFPSTLLLILYPSQSVSDDSGNDFINNLFNSSRGGSIDDDSWYNSRGGGSTYGDPWYHKVSMFPCVHFALVILSMDVMYCMHVMNIVKFERICWIL